VGASVGRNVKSYPELEQHRGGGLTSTTGNAQPGARFSVQIRLRALHRDRKTGAALVLGTKTMGTQHQGRVYTKDSAEEAYFWDVMLDARWNLYYHARYR